MGFIGFIHKNPEAVDLIFKLFIFYVLIAFLQYLIVVIFGYYEYMPGRDLTGPFGLLGKTQARIGFLDPPFIRMNGFWREPSNLSGAVLRHFLSLDLFIKRE